MLVISCTPNYLSFILQSPLSLCEGLLSSEKDSDSLICYFFFLCVLKEGVILFVIESLSLA